MNNPSFPEKVYKYRSWQNAHHKNLLLYNELYFASPKDFNDPFDCRIPPNYINLSEEEREKYFYDFVKDRVDKNHPDFNKLISGFRKRFDNKIEFQKEVEDITFRSQDKYYGIISLSCKWNSILMWSIYSESHKGFCVGFWEEKLRTHGLAGRIKEVIYEEKFPDLKPFVARSAEDLIKPIFVQLFSKSEDWQFEKEYRLVNNYFENEPLPFERLIYVPDDTIAEVILGINIAEKDKNEINKICKFKNIPVYQAIKKPFRFEIDRILIT